MRLIIALVCVIMSHDAIADEARVAQAPSASPVIVPPPPQPEPPARPATPAPTRPQRPAWKNPLGWSLFAVGAAVTVVGGGLMANSVTLSDRVGSAASSSASADIQTSSNISRTAGITLLAVGGAAMITGSIVLIVVSVRKR